MAFLRPLPKMTCTRPRTAPEHIPDGPYKLSVHPGTGSRYVESTMGGRNIPAGKLWALWLTKFSEHCFVIVYVLGIRPIKQWWIFSKCESSKILVICEKKKCSASQTPLHNQWIISFNSRHIQRRCKCNPKWIIYHNKICTAIDNHWTVTRFSTKYWYRCV